MGTFELVRHKHVFYDVQRPAGGDAAKPRLRPLHGPTHQHARPAGNNLNGSTVGKGAYPYPIYGGLALETQVGTSILLLWPCLVCQVWRTSCGGPQSTLFKHALLCLCAAGLA